jgi:MoaA/NifB/PqqE/SkfB family radical SAM enzyme
MSNILHRWRDIEKLEAGEMIRPHFVDFHTSDVCNHHCKGCAYSGMHDGMMMGFHEHMRVIDDLMDFGVKAFDFAGGGEPTMMNYLPELINHIGYRGGRVGLITNGQKMWHELKTALFKYATYVRFSIETPLKDLYCQYKQVPESVYELVMANFNELRRTKPDTMQVSAKFGVSKTLRGPMHYLEIERFHYQYRPDRMTIKAVRHYPEELSDEEKQVEDAIAKRWVSPKNGSCNIQILPDSLIPQCWLNPFHLVVDHKGNAFICCYYYYRFEDHLLGNLLKDRIADIWGTREHWRKISMIDREKCAMVDCKFFEKHRAYEEEKRTGRIFFL